MTISSSLHHFTLSWNLFYVTTSMFFAFILYGLYKIIVYPLMRMKFYKQQGIPCSFFPLIGIYKSCISSLKNHGDAKHYVKIQAASAPERLVCSNLGSSVYLSFFDPALIKEFYLNNENYVKDPIFLEMYKTLLGEGIITSEGVRWKTQRKILSSCFHFDFIKSIVPDVQKTVHQNLENLKNSGPLENVNILDVLQKITGEVVGKLFFGEELNTYQLNGQPLTLASTTLMCDLGQLTLSAEKQILGFWVIQKGIFPKHKKIMETIKSIRGICSKVIQERRRQRLDKTGNLGQKDMLDLLIDYSDSEGKMTDEDITDQFVTFFMAGTDTTGHVALMTIYFLQKYPNFREKVMEEVLENYNGDINVDKLNKMEFTMGVIKETLRTVTPVAGTFPRRAVKDHQIKDITVRKGDLVILDYFYNNFDPKYFDNEQEFDPARWLDKEKMKEGYAFTPFSAGPRNCIGQHISLIELKIIMAEFLKTFDFKVTDGYELKLNFKFLYEPVDPVLLNLVPKNEVTC